jgi:hypothetical protein
MVLQSSCTSHRPPAAAGGSTRHVQQWPCMTLVVVSLVMILLCQPSVAFVMAPTTGSVNGGTYIQLTFPETFINPRQTQISISWGHPSLPQSIIINSTRADQRGISCNTFLAVSPPSNVSPAWPCCPPIAIIDINMSHRQCNSPQARYWCIFH